MKILIPLYNNLYNQNYDQLYNQLYNNFYKQILVYGNINILGPRGSQGLCGSTCQNKSTCKKTYLY